MDRFESQLTVIRVINISNSIVLCNALGKVRKSGNRGRSLHQGTFDNALTASSFSLSTFFFLIPSSSWDQAYISSFYSWPFLLCPGRFKTMTFLRLP